MTDHAARLDALLGEMPIVAILRGIRTDEAQAVVEALFEAGIRIAEVPLNSPNPFATIALLAERFGARMMIGAGTVTDPAEVRRLADCGGRLCVSPHTDRSVIVEAVRLGLVSMPGCATATEAFAALAAGARHLKYFPADGHADDIAALRTVLPPTARLLAVGGVSSATLPALHKAGVEAFGIGSDLYKPGRPAGEVGMRAAAFVAALAARAPAVHLACNPETAIGESPIRIESRGTLWVDPLAPRLLCFGAELEEVALDRPVWSLAALPSGAVAGTLDTGFCEVEIATGEIRAGPAADVDAGCRFNDMAVDPAGGLWAGAMHRGVLAGRGAIFHARAPDAPPICVARGLGVPNGMAFSPDGGILYVIDTLARTLLAYPADPDKRGLGEPAIVTDFMNVPGKPDGMTMGPEGTLWVAMWGGACVVEIGRDGAVLREIGVPAPHISSLCFVGDERLHVTTSRMRLSPRQLADHSGSGGLFAIDLNTAR